MKNLTTICHFKSFLVFKTRAHVRSTGAKKKSDRIFRLSDRPIVLSWLADVLSGPTGLYVRAYDRIWLRPMDLRPVDPADAADRADKPPQAVAACFKSGTQSGRATAPDATPS